MLESKEICFKNCYNVNLYKRPIFSLNIKQDKFIVIMLGVLPKLTK